MGNGGPYKNSLHKYQEFAEREPKSFFGVLLRRPVFQRALRSMSDQKAVPKGLRGQDVERGHTKKPPIPYIPLEDEIGEKVKADPRTFKVKVDGKTTVNASVWMGGSQEGFLIQVINALNYCDRTKLFAK